MPSRWRIRAVSAVVAAVAAVAACAAVSGIQSTEAAWTSSRAVSPTVTAASPSAVPTVTCGAASGSILTHLPLSWTAPSGPTPSRYRVSWGGGAGSGTAYFTSSPGALDLSGINIVGTSVITVYPEYGSWTSSPASLQTRSFTTVAAIVVVGWTCS